jgi:peptidyl-tRNA hydrolase
MPKMTRIQLQPSPFDRLDTVALAVRWWTTQMIEVVGSPNRRNVTVEQVETAGARLPGHITIQLSDTDGFTAHAALPKGHADAHRQALELQLADLSPVKPDLLAISATAIARAAEGATTYAIAMARRTRLDELDKAARRKGARSVVFQVDGSTFPDLHSPASSRRHQRSVILDAAVVASVAASAVLAVVVWTNTVSAEAETLAQRERDLRGAAIAAETARNEGDVSRALVERGVLKRRSYAALEAMARLNTATPNGAWWTRVVWTPEEVTISAQSQNATSALATLSSQAKDWSVEPSGTLEAAPGGGAQSFEFIARPRKAPPK